MMSGEISHEVYINIIRDCGPPSPSVRPYTTSLPLDMLFRRFCHAALLSVAAIQATGLMIGGGQNVMIKPYKREPLQDIVTWDEHSLFVRGERIMFYSYVASFVHGGRREEESDILQRRVSPLSSARAIAVARRVSKDQEFGL